MLLQSVASRGDACQHCNPPNADHTRKWDGSGPEWIQAGPCQGESSLRRPPGDQVAELTLPSPPIEFDVSSAPAVSTAKPPQLTLVAFAASAAIPITSCLQQCPNNRSTPDCSLGTIEKKYEKPLSTIYARVAKKLDDVITTEDLKTLFNADTSKCMRDATTLSKDGIQNTGKYECNIHADLGTTRVGVDITIPKVMDASFDPSATALKLLFKDPEKSPTIAFHKIDKPDEDHPLNDDFGGHVKWIETDGVLLFFRTEKGCVGAHY